MICFLEGNCCVVFFVCDFCLSHVFDLSSHLFPYTIYTYLVKSYVLLPIREHQVCSFFYVYVSYFSTRLLVMCNPPVCCQYFQKALVPCWTKLKAQGSLYDYCLRKWRCFALFRLLFFLLILPAVKAVKNLFHDALLMGKCMQCLLRENCIIFFISTVDD